MPRSIILVFCGHATVGMYEEKGIDAFPEVLFQYFVGSESLRV